MDIDYNTIYGRDKEFREDLVKIPYIKFPSHWCVKPIGPFGGASVRFLVTLDPTTERRVSVYADFHERLGFFGEPHWEVYPGTSGENDRCPIADVDALLALIDGGLKSFDRGGN